MTSVNDFDAAKTIADLLKDMESDRQNRILRWAAESLNIVINTNSNLSRYQAPPETPFASGHVSDISSQTAIGRSPDIKTFADLKKPKTDVQFATVVAYYYRFEAPADGMKDSISSEDLQNAARLAGRLRFPKPTDALNNAKKQGYLDSNGRGIFKINSVGENLVAMTLPGTENGEKIRTTRRKKALPKRKNKGK